MDTTALPIFQRIRTSDSTLDAAQLEDKCPLDNRRCLDRAARISFPAGHFSRLPRELLTNILLSLDIPALTRFRQVNRDAMRIVNSLPQYAAIMKHCPNVVRAILSLRARAYDCETLYETLSTTQCSTCDHFGDHLYLIDCRRVCWLCFTKRPEYSPLTTDEALILFTPPSPAGREARPMLPTKKIRQRLFAVGLPSILSVPGPHLSDKKHDGDTSSTRLRLHDRRAVESYTKRRFPEYDYRIKEDPSRPYMAIISAPHIFDRGRQATMGQFCPGCETSEREKEYRVRYTKTGLQEHIARHGPIQKSTLDVVYVSRRYGEKSTKRYTCYIHDYKASE